MNDTSLPAGVADELERGLRAMGLDTALGPRLLAYLALLVRWNRTYNLTAIRDPHEMVTRHLLDSLAMQPFVADGSLADLGYRSGLPRAPWRIALSRLKGLPRSAFGTALAHFGIGVTLLGIVAVSAFETETVTVMAPGDTVQVGGNILRFERMESRQGPNYHDDVGIFALVRDGWSTVTIESAKRFYPARQMPTTEAGIYTHVFSQTYVSLGDASANVVRVWYKPLVTLIWYGCVLMALGGAVSLADRRLRVGAPARRRKPASLEAGA